MYKENLFKLIRKEEVIIWAGSGFSLYAGLPSSKRLGEILLESLSNSERSQIDPNLLLPDLAEEFYRIKGNNKNSLIRVLKKVFVEHITDSTIHHDKLALIPHFKTIITTNYDKLFENAYGQKGQMIYSSKQIPYLEKEKIHIFKAHGDLSEPDSIIITKSDYNNFLKDSNENDVFWTVIKERLSTKSVLFFGYNLEDPNISIIFDKITEELKTHRKECFLVAPNLAQHKVTDLNRKGIHYINSKAEDIIEELNTHLKENIIEDLEKGIISTDTFRSFLLNNNLLPELKGNLDSFKLNSLKSINGKTEGTINLTLKNDKEFINELNDYITGKKIGEFEISEDKLINVDFRYGGLKFPTSEGLAKLVFKSNPHTTSIIDIRFVNNFELTSIPIKIFGNKDFIEIHIELKNALLKVNLNITRLPTITFNFKYKHNEICSRINDEIDLFKLLHNLGSGIQFSVFTNTGESISKSFPIMAPLLEESQYFLDYFENLKKIEQHYNIRFCDIHINSITDNTNDLVIKTIAFINGETLSCHWDDELQMDLLDNSEQTIEQLRNVNEINAPVVAIHKVEEEIEIHEQKINIGYKKIEFLESYVSNLNEIINKTEQVVKLKSKCKKINISYSKNMEPEKSSPK
ncbi:MAG: hypothetical protein JWN78_657 [Bacteroidota bacterium]|nr:hypothetical protein [Bacteroidota bacterium]